MQNFSRTDKKKKINKNVENAKSYYATFCKEKIPVYWIRGQAF